MKCILLAVKEHNKGIMDTVISRKGKSNYKRV